VRSDQIRSDRHPFLLVGRASTRPRHGIRLLDDTGRRAEREYAAARPAPPRHPWPPGSGGYAAEGDHPKDYAGVGRRGEKLDLWANMPARTSAFAPRAVEHGWGTDADTVPRCPRSTTGTGGARRPRARANNLALPPTVAFVYGTGSIAVSWRPAPSPLTQSYKTDYTPHGGGTNSKFNLQIRFAGKRTERQLLFYYHAVEASRSHMRSLTDGNTPSG
jgi:hypothetical protein